MVVPWRLPFASPSDPRVDCVFHAVLADPRHLDRLVDFLNAVLQRVSPIVSVELQSPVQTPEYIGDGQIIVDVIATDAVGEMFQVEMQSRVHAGLRERMLLDWAVLYKSQLEQGDGYATLLPVVSIWLLDENMFRGAARFHHRFRVRDDTGELELSSHLQIHVLELDRWRRHPDATTPAGLVGWMRFFTEAETWPEVPADIDTPVLESAMAVLNDFKTNAARNNLYRARLEYIRVQNSIAQDMAETKARLEEAEARAESERERARAAEEEAARVRARDERLAARLRALGVDPDEV